MDRIRIHLYKYSFFNTCIYPPFILILTRAGSYSLITENKSDVFTKFSSRHKFAPPDNLLKKLNTDLTYKL